MPHVLFPPSNRRRPSSTKDYAAVFCLVVIGVTSWSQAATDTWTGATSGTWDTTTSNWLDDGVDTLFNSGNDALFTGTPTNNVTSATGLTIGSLTLDNTFTGSVTMTGANTLGGAVTISGGTLSLTNASGLGSSAVTVNGGGTLAINPGTANGTVANSVSGTGLITLQDPAGAAGNTLTLSGTYSGFTGTLNILAGASNNGKVNFSTTTQANVMSSGTIQIQSGATLYLNKALNYGAGIELFGAGNAENLGALRLESNANQTGSVTLRANSFIGVNGSAATISGNIGETGGSFGFTKQGNNTLTLTGSNTYSGITTISAGTLRIGDGGTTGTLGLGGVTNNATLTFNRSNDFVVSNNVTSPAGTGTGIVNKQGAGKLTLSGSNTIGNNLTASAGTLEITGATTIDGAAGNNIGYLTVAGNTSLTVSLGGSLNILGTTGGTKPNSIVGQNAAGTSTLLVNGGTLTIGGNTGFVLGNNINTATGVLTVSSGTATITAGSATLQNPLNFISLGRDNATGIINLDGGTLETGRQFVRDGSGGGTVGSGTATFNFNGGTLKALANQTSGNGWFETETSGNFQVVTTNVKEGGAIINTNGFDATINTALVHSGAATIDGGLTKLGTGTLSLGGANTYTGASTVSSGTLRLDSTGSINGSSGITISGPTARLVQASGERVTTPVTVTTGTLDGTGTLNTVTVSDGTGGVITHGDGSPGTLTIGTLNFAGSGAVNIRTEPGLPPGIATTNLNTAAAGSVALNVSNGTGVWANGVYNLVSYVTLGGQALAGFTPGNIAGLGARQTATLASPSGVITLNIGGDLPVWTGAQNGNWTTNSISGVKNWRFQTAGTSTDFVTGDTVVIDDSAAGANTANTINISDANVSATTIFFNNTNKNYSITSSGNFGISGGMVIKNGTGVVSLGTANSYAGGTRLNEGTLALNHASAIGTGTLTINGGSIDNTSGGPITLVTNNAQIWNADVSFGGTADLNLGTGPISLSDTRTVATVGASTLTLGGPIKGTGVGIIKLGPGGLALGGASTFTGATTITEGTVRLSGAINADNAANNGQITVGEAFGTNAVLEINGGTVNASKSSSPSFAIGANGSNGFVRMNAGTIATTSEFHIGRGSGGYGNYSMSGGSLTSGSWLVVGLNGDRAILNQTGGTIAIPTNRMTIGAGGSGSIGVVNMSGGTFTSAAGGSTGIFVGENGTGVMTMSGTAAVTLNTNGTANSGTLQFAGNATSQSGVFNLNGGILTTFGVTKGASSGSYRFNFNGGTLKANGNNTAFFAPLANTTAYVYPGGGTIDTNGFNVTIGQALLAPTDSGVSAIAVADGGGGAGYLDEPVVTITGGTGAGATARANVAGGVVTGFTITNPGSGYLPGDSLFVELSGGGATIPATLGNITFAANTSGGLTKIGAGTLTLSGDSTYGGTTNINAGVLRASNTSGSATGTSAVNISSAAALTGAGTLGGTVTVNSGAKIEAGENGVGILTVGGLTLSTGSILTYEWDNLLVNDRIVVTGNNGLTINGGTLNLYNAGGTNIFSTNGVYNLIGFTGAITGSPTNLNVDAGSQIAGKTYTFGTASGFVTLQIATAGVTANFWNVGANGQWTTGTNWTAGIAPNAPEAFANFGGGGTPITAPRTVTLNADQTVGSLAFNSAQPFTISGSNTLTLNNGTNAASVAVTQGSHTLGVPTISNSSVVQFNIANDSDTLTVSGPLSGTAGITKFGPGSLNLSGANSYTGTTTLNTGTINISGAGTLGSASSALVVNSGTLNLGGTTQTVGAATLVTGTISNGTLAPSSFTFSGTDNGTVSAAISGSTGVTKNGTGTLFLSGNNTYTGTTALNPGTLVINSNSSLGADNSSVNFGGGGTLQIDGTSATSLGNRTVTGFPGVLIVSEPANTFTVSQSVNSGNVMVKQGEGALKLAGTNTFSATASSSIQAGSVLFDGGSFTGANVTSNIGIEIAPTNGSSAEMTVQNGAVINTNRVIIGGNTANNQGGTAVLNFTSGTINSGQWFHVGHAGNGNGTFNMSGGTLNVNSRGGTQIEIGGFNNASGEMNLSGGVVNLLNNGNINLGNIGNATGSGTVHQTGGTVNFYSDAGTTLGGTGGLRLGGSAGRSGAFTYDLSGGELNVPVITTTSGTAIFNLNGGTLKPTGSSADFIGSTIQTSVQVGGAIINTGSGMNVTIANNLAHDFNLGGTPDGGLRKLGTGALTLSGTSDYTGPTIAEAGTLAVTGSLAGTSRFQVKSGATLDAGGTGLNVGTGQTLAGNGNVIGQVSMFDGSKLSPGESAGTLTFANNLDISLAIAPTASGALLFELGTDSDRASLTAGTLTIGNGALAFNDFAFSALSGFGEGTYTLFDSTQAINGTLDPSNLTGLVGGLMGTLGFADGNTDLVLVVVPEPSAAATLLIGVVGLLGWRRRRMAS